MNKFGVLLGVAAAVTLAGCMDPNYKKPSERGRAVKSATAQPAEQTPAAVTSDVNVVPVAPVPAEVEVATVPARCTCAPGTKHAAPCACGASDCTCQVSDSAKTDSAAAASTRCKT